MPNSDISALHQKYKKLVDSENFEEARTYLAKNIMKFPREMQGRIRLFLFEEGLKDMLHSDSQVITQFQSQGLQILKELEAIDKELEDKLKTLKIQKTLHN